ncbi:MAG: DUF4198 domain-containing protein [Desulfovibrionaceae bacterium]|nr:DUF4198 domain-containing protein [Desulfovibrionaceae bacterium]
MLRLLLSLLIVCLCEVTAQADMMLTYTPETTLNSPKNIDLRLFFSNPSNMTSIVNINNIKEFYILQQCLGSEVKKIDLKDYIKEFTWKNANKFKAFSVSVPQKDLNGSGDYIFCAIPDYYYDQEADAYLQQITKLIINIGGVPGNFHEPCGLPCEIVPLVKPYALWTGNIFKGRVLSQGKPVPNAEIEVEYLNHQINFRKNTLVKKRSINYPNNVFKTQTIYADDQGYFSFGLPRSGWWGFAALNVGPEQKYQGKDLSQDAVIWVQAHDMN